jgi:hypothetical protein
VSDLPAFLVAFFLATVPGPAECVNAFKTRNELARRAANLLTREVESGHLNRAERGAIRSVLRKRDRLLACGPEREL